MKLSLLFAAVLGVAAVSAVPTGNGLTRSTKSLEDDYADFLALVPLDDLLAVTLQYIAEDSEVQSLLEYVLSDDFKALVLAVDAIPEYIRFLDYLQAGGLDVYKWVNRVHELLGLTPLSRSIRALSGSRLASTRITGGVAGWAKDLKALLPMDELRALHNEKLKTSPAYAQLVATLNSPEAKVVYDQLKANEEYQRIREMMMSYGLDVELIFDVLRSLLGMN